MKLVVYKYKNNTRTKAPKIVNRKKMEVLGYANYLEIDFTQDFNNYIEYIQKLNPIKEEDFEMSQRFLQEILSGKLYDLYMAINHLSDYRDKILGICEDLIDIFITETYREFGVVE